MLVYSRILLVSSCEINLNIPDLNMIFTAIAIKLEDSKLIMLGGAEGGVCLATCHFVVGMLLTECRFERRNFESCVIVRASAWGSSRVKAPTSLLWPNICSQTSKSDVATTCQSFTHKQCHHYMEVLASQV